MSNKSYCRCVCRQTFPQTQQSAIKQMKRRLGISYWLTPVADPLECDRKIVSSENLPKEGEVEAPELMNPEKHGRQCTYTFVAAPGERVQLQFRKFYLRGTPPE